MSLGSWSRLVFVVVVGGVILSYISPGKTNRSYLKELIETGYLEKGAVGFVETARKANTASSPTIAEWELIEKGLSQCLVKEANGYLASTDPYLDARANKDTPRILATRFFKACGAME